MMTYTYDQESRDLIGDALVTAAKTIARVEAQCIAERDFPSARDLGDALQSVAVALGHLDGCARMQVAS